MAYNIENKATIGHLKNLATRVNAELTPVKARVKALEDVGAQANVLEGVKVNGTALAIAEKMVDILFATGTTNGTVKINGVEVSVAGLAAMAYKANVSQADLDTALNAVITAKANSADVYSKTEIDGKISSVYKPGGSVAFASLPTADEAHLGMVYNVTDKFTATADFVEGAGGKHPAGTNVVVVQDGDTYKYDVLSGFVDLAEYAKTADVIGKVAGATAGNIATLTADGSLLDSGKKPADFVPAETGKRLMTDEEGTKLGGIAEGATKVEASDTEGAIKVNGTDLKVVTIATDAEVTEMLNEVFGTPEA